MKILAIETSCDETAIALLECEGEPRNGAVSFGVLSNIVLSQVALHAEYGGVFPSLAKREHGKNLVPVLKQALGEANMANSKRKTKTAKQQLKTQNKKIQHTTYGILHTTLAHEPELLAQIIPFLEDTARPNIDAIAVTYGPGLEPALWVGINFAKALALMWNLPIIPINHMEGHFFSAILEKNDDASYELRVADYPLLALLVSGGHTELALSRDWLQYEIVGETRDDAVGEAFDKVARMLGLEYPGGPAIAREAAQFQKLRVMDYELRVTRMPRPMIDSNNFDFSFSGLKTAVLYQLKKTPELTPELIQEFAHEFQEAVVEVLVSKTIKAAQKHGARAVLLGGGVSANTRLKEALAEAVAKNLPSSQFMPAPHELTGDNAVMIGAAAYLRHIITPRVYPVGEFRAEGTLRIGKRLDLQGVFRKKLDKKY